MLKQGTFISKKYYSMLFFNLLGWSVNVINMMTDAILGGNQLGEVALRAVSIVMPLASLVCFFSYIFTPGCGVLYGMRIGEFDKKGAYKAAGASVLTSIIIGIAVAILMYIIRMPFLEYYGCTGELLEKAIAYYNWYIALALIYPIMSTVYYLVLAEGDAFSLMIGSVGSVVFNVVLSYILCNIFGAAGLGMATFIATLASLILYSTHFLKKANSVHIIPSLDFNTLKRSVVLSANTALNYIFLAVVDIIMNKVIILSCGDVYISAYSVVNLILSIFLINAGIAESCQGIVASYIGEKNNYGINCIMKTAAKSLLVLNIIMTFALFFSASLLPKVYGLSTPEVIEASVRATRILALSTIPFSIAYFGYNMYTCLDKPLLSVVLSFLYNFFCPLLLSIPLAFLMGFDGVSIGMSASSFLVIALFVWFIRKRYGKEGFPLYLEDTGEEVWARDLKVTKETIPEIRNLVKAELDERGYEIENLEILIEELYTRIYEKNPGKTICSECALLFGPSHVRIIVRDNGVIFNFVDENNAIESLNAHVLNSLLERTKEKEYLITTSFNRNGFVFEKE